MSKKLKYFHVFPQNFNSDVNMHILALRKMAKECQFSTFVALLDSLLPALRDLKCVSVKYGVSVEVSWPWGISN